jgi:YidC/Oxa1 family membrane protein insertase
MFFQQKMMMPPPADEEQAMQQKMMNFMMIFFGAMFYRVPSGLCIYFIASSVWGMVERWLLNKLSKEVPPGPAVAEKTEKKGESTAETPSKTVSRIGELWNRLQQAADKDVSITRSNGEPSSHRNGKKRKR